MYTTCDHCDRILYIRNTQEYSSDCVAWCRACATQDRDRLKEASIYSAHSLSDCIWWNQSEEVEKVRAIPKIGCGAPDGVQRELGCKAKYYGIECECCKKEVAPILRDVFQYNKPASS